MITEKDIRDMAERHVKQLVNAPSESTGKLLIENIIREALLRERNSPILETTTVR